MSIVDHESSFQVDFPLSVVFAASCEKLAHLPKFTLVRADKILHKITMKVRGNLFSWGENVTITFKELDSGKTEINVLSTPKTGVACGGMLDMGKNRRNIEIITQNISDALQELPAPESAPEPAVSTADFKFICPHCGQHLACPPEAENVECQCPNCQNPITPRR